MDEVLIKISDGIYNHGKYFVYPNFIKPISFIPTQNELKKRRKRRKFSLDGAFVHYLMKELRLCGFYRFSFVRYNFYERSIKFCDCLVVLLEPTKYDLIDYKWNDRVFVLTRERQELDHTLSWLSTLGGAFSALGDYSVNCAVTAGTISIHQLRLAMRLGDPTIQSRCKLYFSLSLIQRKYFKLAKKIIYKEYQFAKNAPVIDNKLVNMCKGIWAKLQYEHRRARTTRRA